MCGRLAVACGLTLLNGTVGDDVNNVADPVCLKVGGQWDVSLALEAAAKGISENR